MTTSTWKTTPTRTVIGRSTCGCLDDVNSSLVAGPDCFVQ